MHATEELQTVADDPPVLGRYRMGRRLGAGGFGAVHEAFDERIGRWVAVKVISADGATPERARREARAAGRLDHPGIVAILDAGQENGARYLVSELVEGRTLADLEADGALSDRDVLRIGLSLADALEHAHERGVIHRDVKPQNIMVPDQPRRGGAPAKLTDFGVAHLAGDEPLTRTGDVVGTLAYMAPEQAAGTPVDERADLYALALVLYEGLAGVNPVRGAGPAATARRLGTVLPSLARARNDLPAELTEAIDRALAPDPAVRGDLDNLAEALAGALPAVSDTGGTIAPHPLERELPGLPRGSERVLAGVAAGGLAAAALAFLTTAPGLPALPAGAATALAVALLPRLGWLAGVLAVAGALVMGADPRPGAALIVLTAALLVPPLVRGRGTAWSVPALAPLLGAAMLGLAYPALAGQARRVASRAALGAAGAVWMLAAEALLGRTLLTGAPEAVPAPDRFDSGIGLAAADVLGPLVTSGALLVAVVWAVAAAVLPWIVRGGWLPARIAVAAAWAAALAAATVAAAEVSGLAEPSGAAFGAAVAAVIAAAWRR
jgi:hypothetical protein